MGDCRWHRCLSEPLRERVTYNAAASYRSNDRGYLPVKDRVKRSIKRHREQITNPQESLFGRREGAPERLLVRMPALLILLSAAIAGYAPLGRQSLKF